MDCLQLCDKGTLVSLCDFLPCLPQLTGHTHSPPLLCPHSGQQHLYLLWAYPDRMDTALGEALCPPNFHVVLYEVLSKCMLTVTRELFEVASEHQFFLCLNSPMFL